MEDTVELVKPENTDPPASENMFEDTSADIVKIENIDSADCENRLEDTSEVTLRIENSDPIEFENRLGTCEECGECPAKYTCPRCEIKSCSLSCVKKHKSEINCSGERDKTAFKRLSEFTNLDLLSDYRMLEETTRSVENYKRDTMKHFTRWNRKLPVHLGRLRDAVTCRGARILFLPQHFARHKSNTTYFDWKTQKISWRIEWVFPQAEFIKAIDERALEDTRISALLNKYLDCKNCPKELQDNLQFYQSAGLSEVCLLLKAEHVMKSSVKFFEIDTSMTLKSALKNKTIIEFPLMYVVLKEHKEMFEVVGSDDEQEEEMYHRSHDDYHHHRFRHQNGARDFKRKQQKNLLFNESDGSDSDVGLPSKKSLGSEVNRETGFNIPDYHELILQNQ
ncbi:Uncharacterized protein GBIM_14165 [Gryllus bimaculatus]|nr:Uncharacterized protein GBIM_14165 [Gryllus bimaculatus]